MVYRSQIAGHLPAGLPGPAADEARESLTGAVQVAGELPGDLGAGVLTAAAIAAAALAVLFIITMRAVPPLDQAGTTDEGN